MLKWIKRGCGAFLVFAGLFLLGSNLWIWAAGFGRLAGATSDVPAGAVLVLLGTDEFVQGTQEHSGTFRPRIAAAAELARSGRVKHVVTSGTDVHARVMAEKLRAAGVNLPDRGRPLWLADLGFGVSVRRRIIRRITSSSSRRVGIACARSGLRITNSLKASAYPAGFGEGWRSVWSALRDCFAKPKALLDHYVLGDPLSTPMPAGEGNILRR